jgi:hypothetical protein
MTNTFTDDELEAGSHKYRGFVLVPLSSGNFAIFAPWTEREGLVCAMIGTWEELRSYADYAAFSQFLHAPTPEQERKGKVLSLADLGF